MKDNNNYINYFLLLFLLILLVALWKGDTFIGINFLKEKFNPVFTPAEVINNMRERIVEMERLYNNIVQHLNTSRSARDDCETILKRYISIPVNERNKEQTTSDIELIQTAQINEISKAKNYMKQANSIREYIEEYGQYIKGADPNAVAQARSVVTSYLSKLHVTEDNMNQSLNEMEEHKERIKEIKNLISSQ